MGEQEPAEHRDEQDPYHRQDVGDVQHAGRNGSRRDRRRTRWGCCRSWRQGGHGSRIACGVSGHTGEP